MMRKLLAKPSIQACALVLAAGLAACSDGGTGPGDVHPDIHGAEIVDAATGERLADVHGSHWHGGLPHLHLGEDLEVRVLFLDDDDQVVELGAGYALEARIADGQPTDVVTLDVHGDHVHIHGVGEGETRVVFQLLHDGHVEYETPALKVEVEDH